jgi:6-phosphogluconolactonase (cycloisomerase 2 family)
MLSKPSCLAITGIALVCATLLAACGGNSTPRVTSVTVAPASGEIYVSAAPAGGVRGAAVKQVRPGADNMARRPEVSIPPVTASCHPLQYTATATFSNKTTKDVSNTADTTWTSSSTSVASVSTMGLATGVGLGTTNISASYKGVASAGEPLAVDQLNSISVSPSLVTLTQGATQPYVAIGHFTLAAGGSSDFDVSSQVTWDSTDKTVATIDNTGTATTVGPGSTTITATSCDGITVGRATLIVASPSADSLVISPATITISTGATTLFTVMEKLANGTIQGLPAGTSVTWSSDTTSVATIDPISGLALGIKAGTTNIIATSTGLNPGSAVLTVVPAVSRFAYVSDLNDNTSTAIAEFSVDVANANLNPLTPPSVAGVFPEQLVVHPSGKFVYEINGSSFVQVYDFSSDQLTLGQLTLDKTLGPYQAGNNGTGKAIIDPTGQFLYVVNNGAVLPSPVDGVYGFTINQSNGALTAIGTAGVPLLSDASVPALSNPVDVLMDHQGKYLYVVNSGNNTVNAYSIDPTSGGLTALSTSPTIGTGVTPNFGTIDPSNTHLYVANTTDNSITVLKLDPTTGILTSGGTDTKVTGATFLFNVAVDPTGKYLYALDSATTAGNNLYAYVLNADGTLPATAAASYPTGAGPLGMSIDASGTVLAVVNNLDGPPSTVSLFSLAPATGVLTPKATVTAASWTNPEFLTFYNAP